MCLSLWDSSKHWFFCLSIFFLREKIKSLFDINKVFPFEAYHQISSIPPFTIISSISQTQRWLMFPKKRMLARDLSRVNVDYAGGDRVTSHWVLTIIKPPRAAIKNHSDSPAITAKIIEQMLIQVRVILMIDMVFMLFHPTQLRFYPFSICKITSLDNYH